MCWRFAMARISDNGPDWKTGLTPYVSQPACEFFSKEFIRQKKILMF